MNSMLHLSPMPSLTPKLLRSILARVEGPLRVIASESNSCVSWTGALNRGSPSIKLEGARYRVQLLLFCWHDHRKAYPRKRRFQRVAHCYNRRCVNPHHIISSSLPSDPLFVAPRPLPCPQEKKKNQPPPSDDMSTSATHSDDCVSVSEDTCESTYDS